MVRDRRPDLAFGCVGLQGLGVAFVVWSSFWDWARSGSRWRDSYQLFGVAERLGVTSPTVRHVLQLWVLLPAVAAAGACALAFRHWRLAVVIGIVVGAAAIAASVAVRNRPLLAGTGCDAALWGGILVVVTGLLAVVLPPHLGVRREPRANR